VPLFSKYSDQQFEQLQAERDALKAERDALKSERDAAQSRLASLQEENGLLLAQLHQVQEELESVFLKSGQFEETAARAADLQNRLNAEAERANGEAQRRSALESQAADLQNRLNAEAARANGEAERANGEASRRAALESQAADLQNRLNAEAARANGEADRANAEAARANSEAARAKDLQEENDLLLAQLHQVQEELEVYYLKNKDLEQSFGETTATLQKARQALVNHLLDTRGHVIPPAPAAAAKADSRAGRTARAN
jgi:chromosome segregation ATPase